MSVLPFAALVLCFFIPAGECQLTIIVEHSQMNVTAGEDAFFSVRPSSNISSGSWNFNGNLVVQWIGQTILISNEYTSRAELFTSNGSLLLKSVSASDSGEYRVNMVPTTGSQTSATVTLKVIEPVSNVTVTSNDTHLIEHNDTVSLSCFANGTEISYLWLKDNTPINAAGRFELSANNATLTIAGVLRTDGNFTCRASNLINELTSSPLYLSVNYGPDHPTITTNTNAYIAGSNITLQCSAVSRPTATLEWYFSGASLQIGMELILDNISVNETGNYICQAYNNITERFSASTWKITVLEPISQVYVSINSSQTMENDTILLTCEANGTIQRRAWFKDNKLIQSDERIITSPNNATLTITGLLRSDTGKYKCNVSNDFSSNSAEIDLQVNYGPDNITIQPDSPVEKQIGDFLTLKCFADSVPSGNYTWYNGTLKLATEQNYYITSVKKFDSGNYTCQVNNDITMKSSNISVMVIIRDAPKPTPGEANGLSGGAIAGIVIGVIAGVGLVCGLTYGIFKAKTSRLNTGSGKSNPKGTSPENIPSSQTEYAEIERKKPPSQPKPVPSSNGANAASAQAKDGEVIYTRPNIINQGTKPTSEPVVDNKTDYAEVKYR